MHYQRPNWLYMHYPSWSKTEPEVQQQQAMVKDVVPVYS